MWVQFLPDGKHFMYLARTTLTSADPGAKIYAQSRDGGPPVLLLASQSRAVAVPDYLLYAQGQKLFAQRMDWETLRQIGKPLLVTRNVARFTGLSRHLRIHCVSKRSADLWQSRGLVL